MSEDKWRKSRFTDLIRNEDDSDDYQTNNFYYTI